MQHSIQCNHMMLHSTPFSFITIYKVQQSVFWIIHTTLRRGMFCWIFYFRFFYIYTCVCCLFSSFRLRIRKVNAILVGCRICSRPVGFPFERSMKMRRKIDPGRLLSFFSGDFSILCFENVTLSRAVLFCIDRFNNIQIKLYKNLIKQFDLNIESLSDIKRFFNLKI